jgi:hypothetical protein
VDEHGYGIEDSRNNYKLERFGETQKENGYSG